MALRCPPDTHSRPRHPCAHHNQQNRYDSGGSPAAPCWAAGLPAVAGRRATVFSAHVPDASGPLRCFPHTFLVHPVRHAAFRTRSLCIRLATRCCAYVPRASGPPRGVPHTGRPTACPLAAAEARHIVQPENCPSSRAEGGRLHGLVSRRFEQISSQLIVK